jgi:hypothetical protein
MSVRAQHRKLGWVLVAFILLWAGTGAILQWQTLSWLPAWAQVKQSKIEKANPTETRAWLLSLGESGRGISKALPNDSELRRLNRIEFLTTDSGAGIARLELLDERTEFVTVAWKSGVVVSRDKSRGPSWVHLLHTGQVLGVPGLWAWLFAAAGLVALCLTGLGLMKGR